MRSKIRCDVESYKILEFWRELNKTLKTLEGDMSTNRCQNLEFNFTKSKHAQPDMGREQVDTVLKPEGYFVNHMTYAIQSPYYLPTLLQESLLNLIESLLPWILNQTNKDAPN